jgi:hypothetical protein
MTDKPKPTGDDVGRAAVNQGDHMPRRVAVAPASILALLRAATGSHLLAPLPDEGAATMGHPLPAAMVIDAGAWVAWCIGGLQACERLDLGQKPDGEAASWIEVIGETAKRVVTVLAMRRAAGNITRAAAGLRTSRRALRERLKDASLHPWPRAPEPTPQPRLDTLGLPRLAAAVVGMRPLALVGSDTLPRPANGPGALAVVQALADRLERAEALRTDGYDPLAAMVRALDERPAGQDLECVATAAWALAVGSIDDASLDDETSTPTVDGSDTEGGE